MESLFEVVTVVGGSSLMAGLGVLIARRILRHHGLSKHHQVSGYFFSVVGTLYALVLGLLVVNVQAKYERAMAAAQAEANACSDIWNFSRGLSGNGRHQLRLSLKQFYTVVQSEPWEKIASGERQEESEPAYTRIWESLIAYQPSGNRESSCYQSCLETLQELSDARSYRITFARRVLAPVVWIVIITGAVLVVIFTYLFFVESIIVQALMTISVAGFIGLNLLLITNFQHPYRDHLHVQSGAFSLNPSVLDDEPQAHLDQPSTSHAPAAASQSSREK